MEDLIVFISYSWDSEEHKEWVRKLADYLLEKGGIEVIFDQYDLAAGKDMTYFMEAGIERAHKVIMILTPEYKRKAGERQGGTGFEHSIISASLFNIQKDNDKFIPVLREGDSESSAPGYIKALLYHDMRNDKRFESNAFELLRILYGRPALVKPQKGPKPDLDVNLDPVLEEVKNLAGDLAVANKRNAFVNSRDATEIVGSSIMELYKSIAIKADEYKAASGLFIKSSFDEYRSILNINGVGLKAAYSYSYERKLEENELRISIWDKPLITDISQYYSPGDEPKQLDVIVLKPIFDDNLQLRWINGDKNIANKDLVGFCFSTLFEFVRKKGS
jgi:hypothetical protein